MNNGLVRQLRDGLIHSLLAEGSNLTSPIVVLLDRLNQSWGPPGKSGNAEEIHHITCLIRDYLEQIVQYEEQIYFTNVPEEYEKLISLFKNLIGSQAKKLEEIPNYLDEVVSLIDEDHGGTTKNPRIIKKTITFELPKGWEKQVSRELKRAHKKSGNTETPGCLALAIGAFIFWLLIKFF